MEVELSTTTKTLMLMTLNIGRRVFFETFKWAREYKCLQIEFDESQINEIEINFCYVSVCVCACVWVNFDIKCSYVSIGVGHSLCSTAFKHMYRCVHGV